MLIPFGAIEVTARARGLEMMAKAGNFDGARNALKQRDRELQRLAPAVANLRDQF